MAPARCATSETHTRANALILFLVRRSSPSALPKYRAPSGEPTKDAHQSQSAELLKPTIREFLSSQHSTCNRTTPGHKSVSLGSHVSRITTRHRSSTSFARHANGVGINLTVPLCSPILVNHPEGGLLESAESSPRRGLLAAIVAAIVTRAASGALASPAVGPKPAAAALCCPI